MPLAQLVTSAPIGIPPRTRDPHNARVPEDAAVRELSVPNGSVTLAGSLWTPVEPPTAAVLMHPGSGPSDRDNDVFFPPIREHLLAAGIAVASFDKRGVGPSTGRWQDAGIVEQAADAIACLESLHDAARVPVGLFGHSQGGWVVLEAAARSSGAAFVVTSSGPGVTPARQERHSNRSYLTTAGASSAQVEQGMEQFDELVEMMRAGTSLVEAPGYLAGHGVSAAVDGFELPVFPDDVELWDFMAKILDHDPRPALEKIEVPVLALFGADDPITPVAESVAVFREAVPPELLEVAVFAGAGHRLQAGDPPALVEGYLDALASFVSRAVA
jgi:pimeloyl-ACP methyl ester carboxylesterase